MIRWRMYGPWITRIGFCGILLLFVGALFYMPSWNVASQEPAAMAAPPVQESIGNISLPSQPFVAIAKQARASVVNISAVRKHKDKQLGRDPLFEDPFFPHSYHLKILGSPP